MHKIPQTKLTSKGFPETELAFCRLAISLANSGPAYFPDELTPVNSLPDS